MEEGLPAKTTESIGQHKMPSIYSNIIARMENVEQKLSKIEMKMDKILDTINLMLVNRVDKTVHENTGKKSREAHVSKSIKKRFGSKKRKSSKAEAVPRNVESSEHAFYKAAVQEEHKHLINDLDIDGSDILDNLLQDEAIYQSDFERISCLQTRKDKARYLMYKLNQYDDSKCVIFCKSLMASQPHLANNIEKALTRQKMSSDNPYMCANCKIRGFVDVRDVVDDLYQASIVDSSVLEMSLNPANKKQSWDKIFFDIKYCKTPEKASEVILRSLEEKYRYIASEIKKAGQNNTFISCTCSQLRSNLETSDCESVSDVSSVTSIEDNDVQLRGRKSRDISISLRRKTFSEGVLIDSSLRRNLNRLSISNRVIKESEN